MGLIVLVVEEECEGLSKTVLTILLLACNVTAVNVAGVSFKPISLLRRVVLLLLLVYLKSPHILKGTRLVISRQRWIREVDILHSKRR